jgi:hypothetical protein
VAAAQGPARAAFEAAAPQLSLEFVAEMVSFRALFSTVSFYGFFLSKSKFSIRIH